MYTAAAIIYPIFNNPNALSPLGTIFGREQNLQGLSPEQKYATINRFKIRFNAVLTRINEVIASNQNKPLSWRGTIAAYIALGGPIPEGVIGGEGANRGGEIAREEPRQLEERPRNNNNAEGLPCTASNLYPAIAKVTSILLAANLDQLQGSYNLKNSTEGELEARVLCGNWRDQVREKLQSTGKFSQLPLEEKNGFVNFKPRAGKGGSPDLIKTSDGAGFVDEHGSSWKWDKYHNDHFDVTLRDGRHFGVYPDGRIRLQRGKNQISNVKQLPDSYYKMMNY